jgi:hypothetical protein
LVYRGRGRGHGREEGRGRGRGHEGSHPGKKLWKRAKSMKPENPIANEANHVISRHLTYHKDHYSFVADPDKSTKRNLFQLVSNMPASTYYNQPLNQRLHNLLSNSTPSGRLRSTLDLGLNFCIKEDHPTNNITKTFDHLRRDIQRINVWKCQEESDNDYNTRLYISQEKMFDRT